MLTSGLTDRHSGSTLVGSVFFVCALLVLCAACSQAAPTTSADAAAAVANWLAAENHRLEAELAETLGEVETFTDDQGAPLYRVVNLDPEGYVVVSADDLIEPIIAFSRIGRYDPSPGNPLFTLLTRDLGGRMRGTRALKGEQNVPAGDEASAAKRKWNTLLGLDPKQPLQGLGSISDVRVTPIVQSKWSQTTEGGIACYNYYTPPYAAGASNNYPCGCVATAMAQVIRWFQYPTLGIGVHSFTIYTCGTPGSRSTRGGDGGGGAYNWSNMPLDPDASTPEAQRQQIGALCHDAGVAVNMDYCSAGSGISNLMKVCNAFTNTFGYSNIKFACDNYNQLPISTRNKAINASLHAGIPTMIGIIGAYGGHMVVCDGYGCDSGTMYHHLNMGWAGSQDAWYNLPNIDSSIPYNTIAAVCYNIYVSGSGEIVSGRVVDSSGSPIEGVTVSAGGLSDVTDSCGVYGIAKLPPNTHYTVTASKYGYSFTSQSATTGTSIDGTTSCGNVIDINFVGIPINNILTNVDSVIVPEGSTAQFNVKLLMQPASDVTVTVARLSGDSDVAVQSGASLLFTSSNWDTWQPVTLAAALDDDYLDGQAVIRCSATGWNYKDVTATEEDNQGAPDTEPPSVPTDLYAEVVAPAQVNLTWMPSTDNLAVTGYKIYRGGSQIGTSPSASYSDMTCSPNTSYTYRVSAYDGAGNESGKSDPAYATTPAGSDVVIDEDQATFTGSWSTSTGAGTAAYNGDYNWASTNQWLATATWRPNLTVGFYKVYIMYRMGSNRSVKAPFKLYYNNGSQTYTIDQTRNGGVWVLLGRKPFLTGTAGYLKLENATGETNKVVIADAARFIYDGPMENEPPTVPTNLQGTGVSPSRIDLTWTASTDNVGVTGYRIFRGGSPIGTSPTTSFFDVNCSPNTTYYYSVSAYDAAGNESAACSPVPATSQPGPGDFIIDEDGASFTGTWLTSTGAGTAAYGGDYKWTQTSQYFVTATWRPSITGAGKYDVYVYYREGDNRTIKAPYTINYNGGSETYSVDQTQNGGQWVFLARKPFATGTAGCVQLSNATGETDKAVIADAVKFAYAGASPPLAPIDDSPSATSTTSIRWTWNDVSDETGYRVKDLGGINKSGDLAANTIQWIENDLAVNTQYSRRVYAFNVYGESAGSAGQTKYTLAKAGESTDGTGATGNVYCTNASKNVWYGSGKTFNFSNPAGFGTGGTWKASKFDYKWNKSSTESWSVGGSQWSSGTINLTADQGDGEYYMHVRAFNADDTANNTDVLDYGPFKCDVTPPSAVTVTDEGAYTPSLDTLKASWTASSDESSGLNHYEYAVGTSPTTQNVKNWADNGLSTSVTISGLSLVEGTTYYVQVRAHDNVGNYHTGSSADGILAAAAVSPISSAWSKSNDTEPFSLRSKIVTAKIGNAFWLEETNGTSAIKVVSSAFVEQGNTVSVAGVLGMSGSQRALIGDVVVNSGGNTAILPWGMACRSLGGGDFNALTPGITGGQGLYNIGLLVRCWGNVTYSNADEPDNKYFYLDDGSGLSSGGRAGVKVRCGTLDPPSSGTRIVTGIVASELMGGSVVPVILVRDPNDIQTP